MNRCPELHRGQDSNAKIWTLLMTPVCSFMSFLPVGPVQAGFGAGLRTRATMQALGPHYGAEILRGIIYHL